jgi:hypothetical protein
MRSTDARWPAGSCRLRRGIVAARNVEINRDPDPAPSTLTIAGFDFEVPEEWRAR